jgi:hypothetical protein
LPIASFPTHAERKLAALRLAATAAKAKGCLSETFNKKKIMLQTVRGLEMRSLRRACLLLSVLWFVYLPAEAKAGGARDKFAEFVKASAWVPSPSGPAFAEFAVQGDDALLRLRSAKHPKPEIYTLSDDMDDVLALLADKHWQFLWQPLTDWAGPTLEPMRDRMLERLRRANAAGFPQFGAGDTGESAVGYKTQALLQLTAFLSRVGRGAEAEALLQERLAAMPLKLTSSSRVFEWQAVAQAIAYSRANRGDFAGAIEQEEMIERTLRGHTYALNATINRAAHLVRSGRYQNALDALSLVDKALAAELETTGKNKDVVPGSNRQFAWIRSCALEGLGRHQEAEVAFAPLNDDDEIKDRGFVIESTESLRFRGHVCMRDVSWLKPHLANELKDDLTVQAALMFQPEFKVRVYETTWESLRADPELTRLASERTRELPHAMAAALNGWRP